MIVERINPETGERFPILHPTLIPLITIENEIIFHNGKKIRVVLSRYKISIGCSDITPNAAEYILKKWKERFDDSNVVLQEEQE